MFYTPWIVNISPKKVKLVRLQIGLELFNLTLYIVIISFLINEEKEKHIFHNNQFNKLKTLILTKIWWSYSPKVCWSDKIEISQTVTLFNQYDIKISLRDLNVVIKTLIVSTVFLRSVPFLRSGIVARSFLCLYLMK